MLYKISAAALIIGVAMPVQAAQKTPIRSPDMVQVVSNAVSLRSDVESWAYVPEHQIMVQVLKDGRVLVRDLKPMSPKKYQAEVTLKGGQILRGLIHSGYDDTRINKITLAPNPNTLIFRDDKSHLETMVPFEQVLEFSIGANNKATILTRKALKHQGTLSLPAGTTHFTLYDDLGWKNITLNKVKKIVLHQSR